MSQSTYEKLTRLKARLSPPNKPATLAELAQYMDCNERSIYRYIEVLQAENCGLKQEKHSPRRYFIQPQMPKYPDSIIRGLKSVQKVLEKTGASAVQGKNVERAIQFLTGEAIPESEVASHAMNVDENFIVDLGPFSEYDENRPNRDVSADKLLDAIKNREKLSLTYTPGHNATEEKFEVCPLKLVLRIDTLYLVAKEGEQLKLFAVRRIKNFHRTGSYFPAIHFDYKSLYNNCFGKFSGNLNENIYQKIKLVMTVETPWLQAQFNESHFKPAVKIRQKNPMVVELNLFDTPDFKCWLLSILPNVKIQEPESLKSELRDLLKKSNAAL